jgi:hypothetical protein
LLSQAAAQAATVAAHISSSSLDRLRGLAAKHLHHKHMALAVSHIFKHSEHCLYDKEMWEGEGRGEKEEDFTVIK